MGNNSSGHPETGGDDGCNDLALARDLGYEPIVRGILDFERFSRRRASDPQVPPPLDGKQWCTGTAKQPSANSKVVLLMTGEAFRARDFFTKNKQACGNATLPVQRRLAENHLGQIVKPIEALGMQVDVFLTHVPCSLKVHNGALQAWDGDFNSLDALVDMYGRERVRGVIKASELNDDMYGRMNDTLGYLDAAMRPHGTYEYFIVLRYDVYLDRPFTSIIPEGTEAEKAHRGLAFWTSTHDFMFAFPGEMWNCMRKLWSQCVAVTRNRGLSELSEDIREKLDCYSFGPLRLREWAQGYAFDYLLTFIGKVVNPAHLQPQKPLRRIGASGFDILDQEHNCRSGWFWPPPDSWEHRYMPYYFHIG